MAKVVQSYKGPSPKSLDSDENFKPNIRLFVAILRFVAIFSLFGNHWAKTVFPGNKVH